MNHFLQLRDQIERDLEKIITELNIIPSIAEVIPELEFNLTSPVQVFYQSHLKELVSNFCQEIATLTKIKFIYNSLELNESSTVSAFLNSAHNNRYMLFCHDPDLDKKVAFSITPERIFISVAKIETIKIIQPFLLSLLQYQADKFIKTTHNKFYFPALRLNHRPIIVVEYNPKWKEEFYQLKEVYSQYLADQILRVEHIGSTSVEGLAAKPVLDIDIIIESREKLPLVIQKLEELGYSYNGDQGIAGREAFKQNNLLVPKMGKSRRWMRHHLYVCAQDAEQLKHQLEFRDTLRNNPQIKKEYGSLKLNIASKYRDNRDGYGDAKTPFISQFLSN